MENTVEEASLLLNGLDQQPNVKVVDLIQKIQYRNSSQLNENILTDQSKEEDE